MVSLSVTMILPSGPEPNPIKAQFFKTSQPIAPEPTKKVLELAIAFWKSKPKTAIWASLVGDGGWHLDLSEDTTLLVFSQVADITNLESERTWNFNFEQLVVVDVQAFNFSELDVFAIFQAVSIGIKNRDSTIRFNILDHTSLWLFTSGVNDCEIGTEVNKNVTKETS
ncbi:hypothetical protein WICPIJ_000377 [Wickerhamomyces pijperi]|uniref:Uncharacterized protein n=1 Tax=Wickerhamomyces pijperi TaxID=599730 RepID=A0A9P8QDN5_WICPI|nr:hypothetical protein WICPIJ_000377 [Wickerhamomyces pijperi]